MKEFKDKDERISLADVWHICRRAAKMIAVGALVCAAFAALWALRMPLRYHAEGSFKDSGKVRTGMTDPFASLVYVTGALPSDSASMALIKSRTVISEVVRKLGLQGAIFPEQKGSPFWRSIESELATIRDNLKVEYALWRKSRQPSLQDLSYPVFFQSIEYCGEVPLHLTLLFGPNGTYSLQDGRSLSSPGALGEPFFGPGYHFTIAANKDLSIKSLEGQKYLLLLQPMAATVQALTAALSLETDRNGKNILLMRFADRDRFHATDFVNTLMETYRSYSLNDDRKVMSEQIAYLHRRQGQISDQLKEVMQAHARRCSQELAGSGFPDVETEIGFFVANHQDYHSKLFTIELERNRLQKYLDEGYVYYDRYTSEGDPTVINKLLGEMRELKQQSDTIELALSRVPVHDEQQLQQGLSQQLQELEQARLAQRSLAALLASVQKGFLATTAIPDSLLHHPRYLIAMWMKRLQDSQQRWLVAPPDEKGRCNEEWEQCKASFTSYLNNLLRLLEVYTSNIEERVVRHQDHPVETQGLDLGAAWELYNLYIKKLSELEAQLLQGEFIAVHMQEPDFEVSSLSTALNDSVSQELFSKASTLVLELRDQANRSSKEIVRLKEELSLQKEFLAVHLRQTLQLWRLNQKTLVGKIHSLQGLLRELIQMRLTVLQKHLDEYVLSRLSNLEQEQQVIQHRQSDLRDQMANLPVKLIEKKMIDHQIAIDRMMIEEVMKLVESKNISSHLEVMQSAPLDAALAPLHPRSCKLLFFTVLGALFGAFAMAGFALLRQLYRGIPATDKSLRSAGQLVIGAAAGFSAMPSNALEGLSASQIELLRSLVQALCPMGEVNNSGRPLLILQGPLHGLAGATAALLAKRGEKVLLVSLDVKGSDVPGLGAFLEQNGRAAAPQTAIKVEGYETIAFGSASPFAQDLLLTQRFTNWLDEQQQAYDYILCASSASLHSALAQGLAPLFPCKAIVVDDITMDTLQPWLTTPEQRHAGRKTAFILAS